MNSLIPYQIFLIVLYMISGEIYCYAFLSMGYWILEELSANNVNYAIWSSWIFIYIDVHTQTIQTSNKCEKINIDFNINSLFAEHNTLKLLHK